jgi:hypothetical protein
MVMAGLFFAAQHHPYWTLLTAFLRPDLWQSAFTNWCPMIWLLARLGFQPCVVPTSRRRPSREFQAFSENSQLGGMASLASPSNSMTQHDIT